MIIILILSLNNIITFSIRTTNLEFNGVKLELQFYIVGRITSLYYIIIQLVIQHNIILSMTDRKSVV